MAVTWTATVNPTDVTISGGRKRAKVLLTTGAATQTVTAGGDVLPALGQFGFTRGIDSLDFTDTSADGYIYKWDSVNGKIRVYQGDNPNAAQAPLVEATGATINNRSIVAYAIGY